MNKLKSFRRCVITSPYEVEKIVDVIARARNHLSKGHRAVCAELMHQAEDKLRQLGKEKENERTG